MTYSANDNLNARDRLLNELAADIIVRDYGTMWAFCPKSVEATDFLSELGTESWQWSGINLVVDHRPARDLLAHIEAESGLNVFIV